MMPGIAPTTDSVGALVRRVHWKGYCRFVKNWHNVRFTVIDDVGKPESTEKMSIAAG